MVGMCVSWQVEMASNYASPPVNVTCLTIETVKNIDACFCSTTTQKNGVLGVIPSALLTTNYCKVTDSGSIYQPIT